MSTHLVGAVKKKVAERMLQTRPVLVLFYMIGCPHCEANEKAWKEATKKTSVKTLKIDADATPESTGVTGFPTMKYIDKNGKETVTTGAKESGDEILKELQVSTRGGSRRRRTHRLSRKLRYRTLRNYISLGK